MAWFLSSLAILFFSALVGYFIVRYDRGDQWLPVGGRSLPPGLWVSTVVLLVSSVTAQLALSAARNGQAKKLQRMLGATSALATAFLVLQAFNWWELADLFTELGRPYAELGEPELLQMTLHRQHPAGYSYLAFFYFFTVLHALHLVGGLIPLAVTTKRSFSGRYTPSEHTGVWLCTSYWHFLDAVWVCLFGILLLG